MERKIGEIFEYNGEWYQAVKSQGKCCSCDLFVDNHCVSDFSLNGSCFYCHRKDGENIMFRKLEKVGEPYIAKNRSTGRTIHFQRYRRYQKPIIEGNIVWHLPDDNFIDIEIRQKQEDMNKEELKTIHGKTVKRIKGNCFDCCFYSKGMCELTMKEAEAQNYGMGMIYMEVKQNKEDMEEKTIKIKKEDIKVGNKVICLSNNKPYFITETNCRMKYNGDWHDCVIYTPLYDNPYKCFVRPIEDFAQNFMLDSAEEEKHSNLESAGKKLKPFNLETAKAGNPVCTRNGRKARIICFDKKEKDFPIVALIEGTDGQEYTGSRTKDGRIAVKGESNSDLMMLPEKKEGWVAVYPKGYLGNRAYQSKEDAINTATDDVVDIIKITWEG